jgi:anti-sigma factor RsiW
MSTREHDQYRDNLAAWLLGALPPLEEELFERHLAGCDVCQREAARLRPAVGALGAAVPEVEPPADVKANLMATVRQEAKARERARPARRRSLIALRPATAMTAVTAVLAVGVLIGVAAT